MRKQSIELVKNFQLERCLFKVVYNESIGDRFNVANAMLKKIIFMKKKPASHCMSLAVAFFCGNMTGNIPIFINPLFMGFAVWNLHI